MEYDFRILSATSARPGEIVIRPADEKQAGRRDLASFVVTNGLAGLQRGEGAPRKIVVSADPTLDDLVAAAFAERLAEGAALPAGAAALARYAALQREGLQPGEVPVGESIEGIFLAQRNAHGEDLTVVAIGARFAADWRRMATVLLDAAAKGVDPFKTPLFSGHDFARERAFLAKDRDVYRQDVFSGERWLVKLPGGPPLASLLLLREPKSLLAKQWARRDAEAPAGGEYLLLGVRRGAGQWVFSTDPVQRLPIQPLAALFQAAEAKADAARAAADPWFDGEPFGYTLVASPKKGTKLPDDEVIEIVKTWTSARRPPTKGGRRARVVAAAAGGALLAAGLLIALKPEPQGPFRAIDFTSRGAALNRAQIEALRASKPGMRGFALLVAVGAGKGRRFGALPSAVPDTAKVYRMLRDRYGFAPEDMELLVDEPERALDADGKSRLPAAAGPPDLAHVMKEIEGFGARTTRDAEALPSQFVFYYAGHGQVSEPGSESVGHLVLTGYDDESKALDLRGYDMAHLAGDIRRKVACPHRLLLIDCCYSGFAVHTRGDPSEDPSRVYEMWENPALAVITAGREDEKAYEREGGAGSYFTEILLEGLGADPGKRPLADGYLKGGADPSPANFDGIVTDSELGVYLKEVVPSRLKRANLALQRPLYFRGLEGDDVGQFLFISRPPR